MSYENTSAIMQDAPVHTARKRIANNTVRYVNAAGDTVWRLHHTDVVTHRVDGTWTLDSGGWKTVTTKERMSRYAPCRIDSRRGVWYIGNVPYVDGMRLDSDGKPIVDASAGPDTTERDTKAIKRRIAKFVRMVDDCTELPQPNNGDCWFCMMKDANGKSWGDASGNTEHLMSHMDEGYLHGSLLACAMRAKGYDDMQIGLHYQMDLRDTFKRALRRYLGRAFGLAVN
jgi:hypothetical protein